MSRASLFHGFHHDVIQIAKGGNCSSRAVPLTQQKESVMEPVTIATLVISVTAGALQAAYWGTRLYRLYRIKKV